MAIKDIEKHIVAQGNYALATAGQQLFTRAGNRLQYNVSPGQIVAYTINRDGTTTTVTGATLAVGDIPRLRIGVGYSSKGNGVVDAIRHLGIEHVNGCMLDAARTSSPKCGSPEVIDFYFDCTECDKTYSLMVKVDDNQTRSFAKWNKSAAEFVGSIVTDCAKGCTDCAPEANCNEVACKLADALDWELELKVGDRWYPDWKGKGLPRPYHVTKLHDTTHIFCLDPQGDNSYIAGIDEITVNSVPIVLKGTLDPANSARTLRGQIQGIADQINQAFKDQYGERAHIGSAYVTGSYSQACNIQLHVNTCDDSFEIRDYNSAPLVPISYNPFEHYATPDTSTFCQDCDTPPSPPAAYNCGIRVIMEPITGLCDCFIEQPLAFYGRKGDIVPYGEGWKNKPWKVVKVQEMELPAGFGSAIQYLELTTLPEGTGRQYNRSNNMRGWLSLPDSTSRVRKAVTADCGSDYCSWYLRWYQGKITPSDEKGLIKVHSTLHISIVDGTTVTSWETFFDKLLELAPGCESLSVESCNTSLADCPADPDPSVTPSVTPTVTPTVTPSPSPV